MRRDRNVQELRRARIRGSLRIELRAPGRTFEQRRDTVFRQRGGRSPPPVICGINDKKNSLELVGSCAAILLGDPDGDGPKRFEERWLGICLLRSLISAR